MKLKVTHYEPSTMLESTYVITCSNRGAAVLMVALCADTLNTSCALCARREDGALIWTTMWSRDIFHGPDLIEGSKPLPHPKLGSVIDSLNGETKDSVPQILFGDNFLGFVE